MTVYDVVVQEIPVLESIRKVNVMVGYQKKPNSIDGFSSLLSAEYSNPVLFVKKNHFSIRDMFCDSGVTIRYENIASLSVNNKKCGEGSRKIFHIGCETGKHDKIDYIIDFLID